MRTATLLRLPFAVCLLSIALALVGPTYAHAAFRPSVQGKKLIASGWYVPSIKYFREHVADAEKLPYDGAIIGSF